MQLSYVCSPQYIRGIDVTACSVIELGAMSQEGDVLRDMVNGNEYEVAGRSLNASDGRGSLAVRGKHRELDGRLLFGGDTTQLQCLLLCGCLDSVDVEADTPIAGLVALSKVDTPGILRVDAQGRFQLLVVVMRSELIEDSVVFSYMNKSGVALSLRLTIAVTKEASGAGPILVFGSATSNSTMTSP
jgi:hypothetical protein